MIKYFCDRCQNELTQYDYDHAAQVTITDPDDAHSLTIYHLCSNCEFAVRHFIKENYKAGEKT
ncbi:hypothetical protein [Ruminococcus sp.]|uniref:hypothetical protein n=1 Tax=Ruminococcus sp. TaxID=41978 RepID=UPI001B5D81FF|nr:hypothetical protein [Ruminococcus sp.]MBP5434167.1 hypothetical protein [Ruminococcus sp.]